MSRNKRMFLYIIVLSSLWILNCYKRQGKVHFLGHHLIHNGQSDLHRYNKDNLRYRLIKGLLKYAKEAYLAALA